MALDTLSSSPLPYAPMMLDAPLAPFSSRRVVSEERQTGCVARLANFEFPSPSTAGSTFKLSLRPASSNGNANVHSALKRMGLLKSKDKKQAAEKQVPVSARPTLVSKTGTTSCNSPLSVKKVANLGRPRLSSPIRDMSPRNTRSESSLVF